MTDPLDRLKAFLNDQEPDDVRRHARFEVIREIGRGGTAIVYEAYDPALKRKLALKVLTSGTLERLRREAEAAARLRHPNVVTVYEVGPDYLAMELVEGPAGVPDLKALLTVARAVAHAHENGVVHRDLKPGNVIVAGDRIVLTDFGLARVEGAEQLTRTGSIAGTPVYMAPEQVRGEIRSSTTRSSARSRRCPRARRARSRRGRWRRTRRSATRTRGPSRRTSSA
jgi:serine/threonine protein kinase